MNNGLSSIHQGFIMVLFFTKVKGLIMVLFSLVLLGVKVLLSCNSFVEAIKDSLKDLVKKPSFHHAIY